MKDHIKTMLIGLFVAIGCSILIGMILFFEPSVGDGKQKLLFRFANINGINVGTRVSLAGKPIGDVVAIEQIPDARKQPTDELNQVYFYQIVCHVDSSAKIYTTDEITMQTSGLLGEKSITILPKKTPPGVPLKLATDQTPLYGQSADPFEYAFNELSGLADKMEDTLDKVGNWMDANGQALGSAIRSFDSAMTEVSEVVQDANAQNFVDHVINATDQFSGAMKEIDVAMNQMQKEDSFSNLGVTIRNLKNISFSVDDIATDIQMGKGTLGKLIVDDGLYLRFNVIMNKVNTLMNDINHYGLMFNLNKQWQRMRVKRVSEITALDSPQEFRSYFEREVDLISTSMERISMLIERANERHETEEVMRSDLFTRDFADLLRSVEGLSDNLKLYNQKLMDSKID
ncbi:MAG: MlaD family protein [Simkaniaceae bacterium]